MYNSQNIRACHVKFIGHSVSSYSTVLWGSQKLNMRSLWHCTIHSIYQRQFFKHLYHFCPERWHDFSPMVLILFLTIILFCWCFFYFYQTILAAGMHPNTHRCHLVLKFKHWMPTARDDTHSLGIFMQRYGHGLSCEHTSSSRTLWLTFSTAALSHSRQTSQGISQCFRAESGCISLFEKLQLAQKNWERKERVECISLKTRNERDERVLPFSVQW